MKENKIIGCGIDIENIKRFERILGNQDYESFMRDVFTEREIRINSAFRAKERFTLGFCAKEALFKSFGISWVNSPITWKDVELIFTADKMLNQNRVILHGFALKYFLKEKIKQILFESIIEENYARFSVILVR